MKYGSKRNISLPLENLRIKSRRMNNLFLEDLKNSKRKNAPKLLKLQASRCFFLRCVLAGIFIMLYLLFVV